MRKGIFLVCLMAYATLHASTLTGTVHNPVGEAMPFVTISLLAADSSLVGGTITADDGSFRIALPTDACLLRASYMGYVSQEHSLLPIPTQALHIILKEATETLAEVVVESKQKLVERRMDKIVMNVAASPFALGNNGKDILKKAPGVNIDRKGKITVNGKAVEIYIDGRPSYLSGAQLKTMLEGTDGSTIDRLEIITQPSAKYDAAGQGGIINIRTKRNKSKGINGSLSGSYGGMYWRDLAHYMQEDHLSLSLHYRGEKTYTAASLTQQCSDNIETFRSEVLTPTSTRLSTYRARTILQYYMLQLGNDWHIDSLNTLGIGLSMPLSLSNGQGLPEHNHSTLTGNGILTEQNTEAQQLHSRWLQPGLNLHYTHLFSQEKERELHLRADYHRHHNRSRSHLENQYQPLSEAPYHTDYRMENRRQTDIYSAQADFETAFWGTGKIECGGKWLSTITDYHTTDTLLQAATPAISTLSAFRYSEHVAALYLTMGKQFGDHWTTKIGLRGEHTLSLGQWQSADSTSRRSYFNLFPTAFVGYTPTEDWSLSLDYARRIQRPPYDMLDPVRRYEDAHTTRVGNPNLKPAFAHNLLFSVGYSEYASIDYTFSHTTDWMDYHTTVHTDGTRVSQALNYGTQTSHGIHLSLTEIPIVPRLDAPDEQGKRALNGAWLALTAQVGASHDTFRSYDNLLHMKHWMVDVYAEMNAYLPHDWTISLDAFYCTPGVWSTERLSAWYEMNLALKKDLPKHGLTLTARVNDLLLSSRWTSTSLGLPEGYANTFIGYDRAHRVSIGITYRFGTALSNTPAIPDNAETDSRFRANTRKRK